MTFARTKPHKNIAIIGSNQTGKTLLVCAMTEVFNKNFGLGQVVTYEQLNKDVPMRFGINQFEMHDADFESNNRYYTIFDCHGVHNFEAAVLAGKINVDSAIIVATADNPNIYFEAEFAKEIGIQNLVIYISKNEEFKDDLDEDIIEMNEMNIYNDLDKVGYNPDMVRIIHGDSSEAINNPQGGYGYSIIELVDALDDFEDDPRLSNEPFFMRVDDAFSITGRAAGVATGRISTGLVHNLDQLEMITPTKSFMTVVTGIEMFRMILDQAEAGDEIGLMLRGFDANAKETGSILVKPGSYNRYSEFEGLIFLFAKGAKPLFNKSQVSITFYGEQNTAIVKCDKEMLITGGMDKVKLQLLNPTALKQGSKFRITSNGVVIGIGMVARPIK